MSNDNEILGRAVPKWFWGISAAAVLWNLMGVAAFIMEVTMSAEERLEAYGAVLAEAAAAQPAYITIAYAIAVIAGTAGSVLLLLRKRLALPVLIVSLVAVLVQQAYMWLGTDAMGTLDIADKALYISIPIIAVFLVWFARQAAGRTILK